MVDASSEEDEVRFESGFEAIQRQTTNRVARAAFAINRDERNELIALRNKMMEMKGILARKGISMTKLEEEALVQDATFNNGSGAAALFVEGRDDFGLPNFHVPSKENVHLGDDKVFVKVGDRDIKSSEKEALKEIQEKVEGPKSWTNIVKDAGSSSKSNNLKYYPPQSGDREGIPVINPLENSCFQVTKLGILA